MSVRRFVSRFIHVFTGDHRITAYLGRDVDRAIGAKVSLEYSAGRGSLFPSARIRFGGRRADDDLGLQGWIPGLRVWLSIQAKPIRRALRALGLNEDREIGFRTHDGAIWWTIWRDAWAGWDRSVPRWREGSWHPLDTFFGREVAASREIDAFVDVPIAMPERTYSAKVVLVERTLTRPRLPWLRKVWTSAVVDLSPPIPVPGKGENSWDCGDDALHGGSYAAASLHEAIAAVTSSVWRSRIRYGGRAWQPDPAAPPPATSAINGPAAEA